MLNKILLAAVALVLLAVIGLAIWIGPRNIVGFLRYGSQRREGALKVGDRAPDVALGTLDGGVAHLADFIGAKPLVIVFGSYT